MGNEPHAEGQEGDGDACGKRVYVCHRFVGWIWSDL